MFNLMLLIFSLLRKPVSGIILILLFSTTAVAKDSYSSFNYKIEGQGQDIVLIPGLMSDERVWTKTADVLAEKNRIHIISVAGFGRAPTSEINTIIKLETELGDYISKLDQPILIGHSLGGFLALSLAIDNPDDMASVISVDGLPFIGPVFTHDSNTQVSDVSHQASYIKNSYAKLTKKQLSAEVSRGIDMQATTKDAKKLILDMSSLSDPETVGAMMYSLMTTDLRSSLQEIKAKVMFLGASGAMPNGAAKDQLENLYKDQFTSLSSSRIRVNRGARHFIMFDDLDWLLEQINDFIRVKP